MGTERGLTVGEFRQELCSCPDHYEVRLGIGCGEEGDDVPLSRENIQCSGIMSTITIMPIASDFSDETGEPRRLSSARRHPPRSKAAPDETPPAVVPHLEAMQEVKHVVFCTDCRRVFIPGKEIGANNVLPCGHTPSVWMVASCIVDNERDSQFIDWMDRNGHLEDAIEDFSEEGGIFDPQKVGRNRLVFPKED